MSRWCGVCSPHPAAITSSILTNRCCQRGSRARSRCRARQPCCGNVTSGQRRSTSRRHTTSETASDNRCLHVVVTAVADAKSRDAHTLCRESSGRERSSIGGSSATPFWVGGGGSSIGHTRPKRLDGYRSLGQWLAQRAVGRTPRRSDEGHGTDEGQILYCNWGRFRTKSGPVHESSLLGSVSVTTRWWLGVSRVSGRGGVRSTVEFGALASALARVITFRVSLGRIDISPVSPWILCW